MAIEAKPAHVQKAYKRRVRGQGKDGTEQFMLMAEDLRTKLPVKFGLAFDSLGAAKLIAETIGRVRGVSGSFAEVGCWKGGTGWFIREIMKWCGRQSDRLYLYDTFEGFVDVDAEHGDDLPRSVRYRDTTEEEVKALFAGDKNVIVRKGRFPDSTEEEADEKFAFVHLDVDTYLSTKDSLFWLLDRMSPGGAVLLDDWQGPYSRGATKAIQEFASKIDHEIGELILFPRKAIYYSYSNDKQSWGGAIETILEKKAAKKAGPAPDRKNPPKSDARIVSNMATSAQSGYGPTLDPTKLNSD